MPSNAPSMRLCLLVSVKFVARIKLFRYDKTIQLTEHFDMSSYLDADLPIDLNYIQDKSIDYIKNYMYLNRTQLVDLVKYLRYKEFAEYINQLIDTEYYSIISFWAKNYIGLDTKKGWQLLISCRLPKYVWFRIL